MSSEQDELKNIDYKRMFTLGKWIVSAVSMGLTGLGVFFGILFYKDRQEMNEQSKNYIDRTEAKLKEAQQQYKETLDKIKEDAEKKVINIQEEARRLALQSVDDGVKEAFKTHRIEEVIELEARLAANKKVGEIVNERMTSLLKISDAASAMRAGRLEGLRHLKYYMEFSATLDERKTAKMLYGEVCQSYEREALNLYPQETLEDYYNAKKYPGDKQLTEEWKKLMLKYLIRGIYINPRGDFKYEELSNVASKIRQINLITGQNFKCFELEKINIWARQQKDLPTIELEQWSPLKP